MSTTSRPKLTPAERGSLGGKAARAAREARLQAVPEDELAWARELWARREAAAAEDRVANVRGIAAALVRCVGADDAAGVGVLLDRVRDWKALAVVLAECADPARVAVVACQPYGPLLVASTRASAVADDAASEGTESVSVDQGASDEAA